MKTKVFILLTIISRVTLAQIPGFEFQYTNRNEIAYDSSLFVVDTICLQSPSKEYLNKVIELYDDEINERYYDGERYVFPIRVKCNSKVYLATFTAAGLYAASSTDMNMQDFQHHLAQLLENSDTIVLEQIPIRHVGSSNYIISKQTDVEIALFRKNKWLFLNYFFREIPGLTDTYQFIGLDEQIPAVVAQLYNWGILVVDGGGSDQTSAIYIRKQHYPDLKNYPVDYADREFVKTWMKVFRKKQLYKFSLIDRGWWHLREDKWWK